MEEPAPYGLYRKYHTPSGMINARIKRIGENILPLGCFYDPVEIHHALINTLENQLSEIFEKLDSAIRNTYIGINIHYEGRVYKTPFKGIELWKVLDLSISELQQHSCKEFSLALSINKVRDKPNDVEFWGTLFDIESQEFKWYDEIEDENLPVWGLSIANEILYLEHSISEIQINTIVNCVIHDLEEDYKLTYLD